MPRLKTRPKDRSQRFASDAAGDAPTVAAGWPGNPAGAGEGYTRHAPDPSPLDRAVPGSPEVANAERRLAAVPVRFRCPDLDGEVLRAARASASHRAVHQAHTQATQALATALAADPLDVDAVVSARVRSDALVALVPMLDTPALHDDVVAGVLARAARLLVSRFEDVRVPHVPAGHVPAGAVVGATGHAFSSTDLRSVPAEMATEYAALCATAAAWASRTTAELRSRSHRSTPARPAAGPPDPVPWLLNVARLFDAGEAIVAQAADLASRFPGPPASRYLFPDLAL